MHTPSSRYYQRGALGLFGLLVLLISILFAALAVDSGRLMMEQRQLQTVADMAAMDAASVTGECGADDLGLIQATAEESAARNDHSNSGNESLTTRVGISEAGSDGVRQFSETAAEQASAVEVIASKTVPASIFAGGFLGNDASLSARAVAGRQALAAFSAGSELVSLASDNPGLVNDLLSGLLGSQLDLDAVSYEGIADADVSLADLVAASAESSEEALLDSEMGLGELLEIYANAIDRSENTTVEARTGAESIAAASVDNGSYSLGEILDITTDSPEAAGDVSLNMLDVIMTSALVANGDSTVSLSPTKINLPGGLLDAVTEVTVTKPQQIAIGPPGRDENGEWRTMVDDTAQIKIINKADLSPDVLNDLGLSVLLEILEILGLDSGDGSSEIMELRTEINVAGGEAWLENIVCNAGNNAGDTDVMIGARPGTLSSAPELTLVIPGVLEISLEENSVNEASQPGSQTQTFSVDRYDEDSLPETLEYLGTGIGLTALLDDADFDIELLAHEDNCGLLGLSCVIDATVEPLLNALLGDLTDDLLPVIEALEADLLDPFTSALGVNIASMDVELMDVEVSRPELKE